MLGPLLFVYSYKGVLSNILCFSKKNHNSKKNYKKSFHKKNFLLNVNLKSVVKQKDTQGPYWWAKTKIQPEKIKIESKKCLNHTSETQKSFFSSISYFEKCFNMKSLHKANFSLVWPNFCTPYWTSHFLKDTINIRGHV